MMEAVQIDFFPLITEAEHPQYLLNGKPAGMNACGVFTENVLEFREGKLTGVNIEVRLCAVDKNILFEFSYQAGTYGCGHPLWDGSHKCHRNNSAPFLAEMVFSTFKNSVVPYDKNLVNYPKETKELLKLCKKACDRIAKEVA